MKVFYRCSVAVAHSIEQDTIFNNLKNVDDCITLYYNSNVIQ